MLVAYVSPSATGDGGFYSADRRPTPTASGGTYTASKKDFVDRFQNLLRRWRSETSFFSNPDMITSHPCFEELVRDAEMYIPLIIEELKLSPSSLVWVLDDAVSEQPYPNEAIGDLEQTANAWIAWAERNGRTLQG